MTEFRNVNGKIEVWECTKTYDESEVKIVSCCKNFIIRKSARFFVCTCGRHYDVDSEGRKNLVK